MENRSQEMHLHWRSGSGSEDGSEDRTVMKIQATWNKGQQARMHDGGPPWDSNGTRKGTMDCLLKRCAMAAVNLC